MAKILQTSQTPTPSFPCFSVLRYRVHLLQLMNQCWYIMTNQSLQVPHISLIFTSFARTGPCPGLTGLLVAETLSQASLVLMTGAVLRGAGQGFCKMSLNWNLMFSLMMTLQ